MLCIVLCGLNVIFTIIAHDASLFNGNNFVFEVYVFPFEPRHFGAAHRKAYGEQNGELHIRSCNKINEGFGLLLCRNNDIRLLGFRQSNVKVGFMPRITQGRQRQMIPIFNGFRRLCFCGLVYRELHFFFGDIFNR